MDEKDVAILQILQDDAKAPTGRIAKQTGIPTTTVHNRIKRMEAEGIIQGYAPIIDWDAIGLGLHAKVFVTAQGADHDVDQEQLADAISRLPGVRSASIVTGTHDLILDVRVRNVQALDRLLIKSLRAMPGVAKTETLLVLDERSRSMDLQAAL